jgi:predicted TPR repeat methyltransferase
MSETTDRGRLAAALTRAAEEYASAGHMEAAASALRSACELRPAPAAPAAAAPAATSEQDECNAAFGAYLAGRFC